MKRLLPILAVILFTPSLSWAACLVNTGTTTYPNGQLLSASECDENGQLKTTGSGGATTALTLASSVTTDTTSTAVAGVTGFKTFWGEVVCSSGACAQTQAIYGARENAAANGVLLCTITLSGTTRAQDACASVTANYSYYYVVTTGTSGTAATGGVYAMY